MNLDPLRSKPPSSRAPEYAERSVNVGFFEMADGKVGLLWYAKPALTEDMPAPLLAHREKNPDYPRESTVNQFFDYSTYIAYRNLGRYNGQKIRQARADLRRCMDIALRLVDGNGNRYVHKFDAFRALPGQKPWVCTEIADLIERRASDHERQERLFLALAGALLGSDAAPVPAGGAAPPTAPLLPPLPPDGGAEPAGAAGQN
jgi:hypothetical protein